MLRACKARPDEGLSDAASCNRALARLYCLCRVGSLARIANRLGPYEKAVAEACGTVAEIYYAPGTDGDLREKLAPAEDACNEIPDR